MVAKFFILIFIKEDSNDYDILLSYLSNNLNVKKLSVIARGLLIEAIFKEKEDRKKWFSNIVQLDVDEIIYYEILYKEFLFKNEDDTKNYNENST